MNPYALTGTAPSRRRVYLFHHLGSTTYLKRFRFRRGKKKGPIRPADRPLFHLRFFVYGWKRSLRSLRSVTGNGGSKSESGTSSIADDLLQP